MDSKLVINSSNDWYNEHCAHRRIKELEVALAAYAHNYWGMDEDAGLYCYRVGPERAREALGIIEDNGK